MFIPGFDYDAEKELQDPSCWFTVDENASETRYMLIDIDNNRILLNSAVLEAIQAYALTYFKEIGTTEHLSVVDVAAIKRVTLGLSIG